MYVHMYVYVPVCVCGVCVCVCVCNSNNKGLTKLLEIFCRPVNPTGQFGMLWVALLFTTLSIYTYSVYVIMIRQDISWIRLVLLVQCDKVYRKITDDLIVSLQLKGLFMSNTWKLQMCKIPQYQYCV